MKTYKSILVQMVFILLLSHLSFSQEVEVNLGGNSNSDAFVVKDSSGNVLLKMDGDKNFGINSEQTDGIEIKGEDAITEYEYGDSIKIIGGTGLGLNGFGGSVSMIGGSSFGHFGIGGSVRIGGTTNYVGGSVYICSGSFWEGGNIDIFAAGGYDKSGNINIRTGSAGQDVGDINISTSFSNDFGGSITLSTGFANSGANDIILETGGTPPNEVGNSIKIMDHQIELNLNTEDAIGIILNPNDEGLVKIIGSGTYTGTWTQASDERYKRNIKPISGILNKIEMLKPVEYEWNKEEFPEQNFPDGNQIGLIAQEVEKLFPEMVATNKDGYKSIDYSKLSVLLLQAVKEQQNEMDKMKSDIQELKSMILQDPNKFSSNDNQQEVN